MSCRYSLLLVFLSVTLLFMQISVLAVGTQPTAPPLVWIDAETGSTLFTINDVVRVDWDKQLYEITPERATELLSLPIIQRRDFAVKDRDGVIYRGRFYRTAAAGGEGYDGTTVLIGQDAMKTLPALPFFTVSGGYPTGGGTHDRDRFSPRVHDPLAKAGLLATIPDAQLPYKRFWSGHAWVGGEQVIKASAVLFEETFRTGQDAYLHLLLYKGQHPDFVFDKMIVTATCTSEDGSFVTKQDLLTILPPLLDNGIYVGKFRPWEGMVVPSGDNKNQPVGIKQSQLPRYPKDALNENKEGVVIVAITVGDDGKPDDISLVQSSKNVEIDKSALRTVKRWQFIPATIAGQADKGVIRVSFNFAAGKVEQTVLPPDPVKVTAKPGMMNLALTITALKKDGNTFTPIGSWPLPSRKIKLLDTTEQEK